MEGKEDLFESILRYAVNSFPTFSPVPNIDVKKIILTSLEKNVYAECKSEFYNLLDKEYDYYNLPDEERKKYSNEYYEWKRVMYDWLNNLISLYRIKYSPIRSVKETAELYADRWCQKLFGSALQDNGDHETETSFKMNMLATIIKAGSMEKVTPEQKDKFRELCTEYAMRRGEVNLSCDYHPQRDLYDMLSEAGIEEGVIDDICPWKFGLYIDRVDNHICERNYNVYTYF